MFDGIPIGEYFRYHPPQTEVRKVKHQRVNDECLEVAKALTQPFLSDLEINRGVAQLRALTQNVFDALCVKWATTSIDFVQAAAKSGDEESIIMHIQQVRMFLNQGITIDELRAEQCKKNS